MQALVVFVANITKDENLSCTRASNVLRGELTLSQARRYLCAQSESCGWANALQVPGSPSSLFATHSIELLLMHTCSAQHGLLEPSQR